MTGLSNTPLISEDKENGYSVQDHLVTKEHQSILDARLYQRVGREGIVGAAGEL